MMPHHAQLLRSHRRLAERHVDGLPFALPGALDRISERWWNAHPRTRFSIVVALLVLVGAGLAVRVAANPYGAPEAVIVATRQLAVGQTLRATDIERQRWPRDLLPAAAVGIDESDVLHSQIVVGLAPGGVITREHIGQYAIAGQLHDTERAVAVPAGMMPAGLLTGSRLDLIARDLHGAAARLATNTRVVAINDEVIWVAVADADSPAVAATAAAGMLTATIRPG